MSESTPKPEGPVHHVRAVPQRNYDDPYAKRLFLIIDSLPQMQRALSMTLSSFGANMVEFAGKPSDALAKMAKYDFDVVLCDYDLGNGYDGLYLFEEVRERNLLKQSCVFMIVTGERRAQRVISAAELAPDDYLLKPFTGEVLRERLERAMRKREAFRLVDESVLHHEYLSAIEACNGKIEENSEFSLDFIRLKGSLALKIEDYDTARDAYMQVLRLKPATWAKMGLAKALVGLRSFDEAKLLFESVLADNNQVMEAYDWLARLYRGSHDLNRAQHTLQTAAEMSPVVFRRQQQLAEVAMLNHDLATAEAACQQTLDIAKYTWHRSPIHYAALARIQLARGDTNNVSRTLASLRHDYRYNDEAEWLANVMDSQLQAKSGNSDKARELLETACARFKQLAAKLDNDAQLEFARACYQQGRDGQADTVMQYLVRNNHDDESLLAHFGDMYEELGMAAVGRQLIAQNVQSVLELNNQAVREAQAGQFESAIDRFGKALEEMPQNIQIMLNTVNAVLAFVSHHGWHESHMRRAYELMGKVRDVAPANNKFQKILQSWRATVDKMDKPQWAL
ncbi:tetratricopeptide repeat-containing response regulator [Chromobacterium sp. IIBBL 290-4]|uniref:tetratricopeptide repeat-containing response regulator n=1 Tax=Chromobacterium sp. IIBBL 290-4 TaxID=2953890 RepID=UPI0020B822E3|nr:tetratricopeptide repeat-containing response regulator [Chromobacterium sp. IIBBL 290-4]UTH75879.1 response regulator [Chromobacterium sp. IIBBL 290-4]